MRRALIAIGIASLVAAMMPAAGAATLIRCGSVIKSSIKLEYDLLNCPHSGLVIGADGVQIDLGDNLIDGTLAKSSHGIDNAGGYDGVAVVRGEITGFSTGIFGNNADNWTIDQVEFSGNTTHIGLLGGDGSTIRRSDFGPGRGIVDTGSKNLIDGNDITSGRPGITVTGDQNRILNNDVTYSARAKVPPAYVITGNHNQILKNSIENGDTGLSGAGSDNLLQDNDFETGIGNGILFDGSSNRFISNLVEGYHGSGIWLNNDKSTQNYLYKNDLGGNGNDGAFVESPDTNITTNDFSENNRNGLQANADSENIADNTADDNVNYGIVAVGKNLDGGNNEADGNGKAECNPRELCA